MNRPEPDLVEQTLSVLRMRQAEEPSPVRAATIDELASALEGEDVGPLPDALEAIETSSLSEPEVVQRRRVASPEMIAEVVSRAMRRIDVGSLPARGVDGEGATVDWWRELRRLEEASPIGRHKLLTELDGIGIQLTDEGLARILHAAPLVTDREVVQLVVTVLGGDWTGGGYEAAYDAALDEQRRLDCRPDFNDARQDISGLAGADPLTASTLRRQAWPDFDLLPRELYGRSEVVAGLVDVLERRQDVVHALVGAPGCGKSALALTLAREASGRDRRVWWVSAHDPNQVVRGMLAVATQVGAPVTELNELQSDPAAGIDRLWQRLDASPTPWLLVLDDLTDPELLTIAGEDGPVSWVRPSATGVVLVTCREPERTRWTGPVRLTTVPDLSAAAGSRMLGGDDAGRALSERLGGVPEALRLVRRHLEHSGSGRTARVLLDELPAPQRFGVGDRAADRIADAWSLVVRGLGEDGHPEAVTLLRVLSHYAPGWVVPLDVISPARLSETGLPGMGGTGPEARRRWARARAALRRAGLIDVRRTAAMNVLGVVVHPLVAEAGRLLAGPDDAIEAVAVDLLLRATARLDAGRPAHWAGLRRLEPHTYALLDNVAAAPQHVRTAALDLSGRVAEGLVRAGLFVIGEALVRHALDRVPELGPDAPERLDAEHALAWALGLRGELAESESRLRQLVRVLYRTGPGDDLRTLVVRDHLAWVLAEQGRLAEAGRRLHDLLPTCARVLGPEHRLTLAVRHRIAWITALRGRPDLAEVEFADLLPMRVGALGADHIDVLSSRYRLAWVRCQRNRFDEARVQFEELLADVERLFDPDAAAVIMVRARLGYVNTWSGRFPEAEIGYRRVLEARTRVLGAHHPRTLRARHDLAWSLSYRGDYLAAERLYRSVLAEVEQSAVLGRDHPLAVDTRGRLTALLIETGHLDEGERRARTLVTDRHRVSGPEHPATLIARRMLGDVLLARGRLEDAQACLEPVLADQERLLASRHRHTLETGAALAEVIGRRGRLAAAEQAVRRVLADRHETLGRRHRHTLASREQLVWVLGERDTLTGAIRECRGLIADRRELLGPLHPDTLSARYRLAWLLYRLGRWDDAAGTYRSVIPDQHRVLGREHPHTLRSRHGSALVLLRAGRIADGERELRSVLVDRMAVLGPTHPDTLNNRYALAFALALGGHWPEAETAMSVVFAAQLDEFGPLHRSTLASRERLGWMQARQGRLADPASYWGLLLADREQMFDADHPDTIRARQRVANPTGEVARWW